MYELMNDYPVHTKAVLINDRLSVVGSYNLDMRSTYLDTELMLVIDSEKLSQQIHETESDYMEKSKEVLANGQETEGAKYQGKVLNRKKSYTTVCSGLSFVLFGSCFRMCLKNHSHNLHALLCGNFRVCMRK